MSQPLRLTESVSYTRVALDPPFDIIRARFSCQKFVTHIHDEYAIGIVEYGHGRISHARGTDNHPCGSIIVIPPGLAHSGESVGDDGLGYRMMYLPVAYLDQAMHDAGLPAERALWLPLAIEDDALAARIEHVHAAFEAAPVPTAGMAAELAGVLCDLVWRHRQLSRGLCTFSCEPTPELQSVRAFLNDVFMRPVRIDEMASIAGLSPYYLIRAFHRAYGMPPYTYVEHLRVQRARQLIEEGHSITDAALMAGFSDQSHLTRRFKRTLGITPGVIARRSPSASRARVRR